jgi:hypothetical protein
MNRTIVIAAAALPIVLAWGALGWYGFLLLSRRDARLAAARKPKLSEEMRYVMTWRPE